MKKNLFTNLLAIAAVMATASCAKEVVPEGTGEPSAEVQGKCFIAEFEKVLQDPQVKTALDENRVPVWVEGDAVGVTTSEDANVKCTKIAGRNAFDAQALQGAAPFYAVYPYSSDNTFTAGVLTGVVPSVQQLAEGENVASAALVAACKSENYTLSFKNCVSLLQIEIPSTDIKKVKIAATTAGSRISGKFTLDLSADVLEPAAVAAEADSTVTLLPSGAAFAAGTYYVAVIPSTTKAIKITFTNTGDEEVSVSKSASTTFVRSNGINLGSFFKYEIGNAEDLINWAAATAKSTAWDVVNINSDITLTDTQAERYVEANEFKGTFEGNNHTISGLKTPLFGNLRGAVVRNIKVNATITSDGKSGAWCKGSDYGMGVLAHYAYPDGGMAAPAVSNVETSGSITITGLNMNHNYLAGGMLGAANNVPLTDCVNKATVVVNSASVNGNLLVGGLVGATQSGTKVNLTGCSNEGNVTVTENVSATTELCVGGVTGKSTQAVKYENCVNKGNVLNKAASSSLAYTGGVVGFFNAAARLVSCSNEGAVADESSMASAVPHSIAGVLGYASSAATLADCGNKGAVTLDTRLAKESYAGGVVGYVTGAATLENVVNEASVTDRSEDVTTSAAHLVAGVISRSQGAAVLTNCKNLANGTVTMAANINGNSYVGGVISYTYTKTTISGCENYADLTDQSAFAIEKNHNVGGIAGTLSGSAPVSGQSNILISGCKNFGNIMNHGKNSTAQMGGILASCTSYLVIRDCENGCASASTVISNEKNATSSCYIGGIIGAVTKSVTIERCKNFSEIRNSGVVTSYYRIAGIIGNSVNAAPGGDVAQQGVYTDCENYGDIVNDSNSTKEIRLGGIIGTSSSSKALVSGCKNFGDIYETSAVTASSAEVRMGGIEAHCGNAGSKFVDCVSSCDITPRANTTSVHFGQILGHYDSATAMSDFCNHRIAGSVCGVAVTADNLTDAKILYGTTNWAFPADKLATCSLYTE